MQSQCPYTHVIVSGYSTGLKWEPLEDQNIFAYASGMDEGTITTTDWNGQVHYAGDYVEAGAAYLTGGFENMVAARVHVEGSGNVSASLERSAGSFIYQCPFKILDMKGNPPTYLPSPIPMVIEYKIGPNASHSDYNGNTVSFIRGIASADIEIGTCGYPLEYLHLNCVWDNSVTPLCHIVGGDEVDEIGSLQFTPSNYYFVISYLANIKVNAVGLMWYGGGDFSEAELLVDPYVYIDSSYSDRDQLQVLTLTSPDSDKWVPCNASREKILLVKKIVEKIIHKLSCMIFFFPVI